ncbi:MAG: hypothetical protein LBL28_03720 [Treponema sp.]|nr:hypothetical protein [Treponema sp.]
MDEIYAPKAPPPPSRPPYCLRCAYFSVSWDPALPRACDFFGFKCQNMPSLEVYKATGQNCTFFNPRGEKK